MDARFYGCAVLWMLTSFPHMAVVDIQKIAHPRVTWQSFWHLSRYIRQSEKRSFHHQAFHSSTCQAIHNHGHYLLCLIAQSLIIYLLSVLQLWNVLPLAVVLLPSTAPLTAARSSIVTVDYPTVLAVLGEYYDWLIINNFSWYPFINIAASASLDLANVDHKITCSTLN